MYNYKEKIENLYFHDSNIQQIQILSSENFDRKLILDIEYYNWENNSESSDNWTTRILQLKIDHCVHFQINAPNLM